MSETRDLPDAAYNVRLPFPGPGFAIRAPRRGKAHRPNRKTFSVGTPWEFERVAGTWCGYRDCPTVWRMIQVVAVEKTDPSDRCARCWPEVTP